MGSMFREISGWNRVRKTCADCIRKFLNRGAIQRIVGFGYMKKTCESVLFKQGFGRSVKVGTPRSFCKRRSVKGSA